MAQSKFIYVGIKGSVMALNSANGQQLWVTPLKGGDFVNVALDRDNLYAATRGEVFCLDPRTGIIRWHNALKGYGWGLVSLSGAGVASTAWATLAAEKIRREQEAASASADTAGTT